MPLLAEEGIVEQGHPGLARREVHGLHARERAQVFAGLGLGDGRVVADAVPAVQAGGAVARLVGPGVREDALDALDADGVERFRARGVFEAVGRIFAQIEQGHGRRGVCAAGFGGPFGGGRDLIDAASGQRQDQAYKEERRVSFSHIRLFEEPKYM